MSWSHVIEVVIASGNSITKIVDHKSHLINQPCRYLGAFENIIRIHLSKQGIKSTVAKAQPIIVGGVVFGRAMDGVGIRVKKIEGIHRLVNLDSCKEIGTSKTGSILSQH